jgi:hypothetical protein
VQVQRHEVVDVGVDLLQGSLVVQGLLDGDDGPRCEVGHDKDSVDAGGADGRGDEGGDGTRGVAQVHVHVGRRGERVRVLEGHCGGLVGLAVV